ncbi:MAG: FkbM family methyltransferase, partial [Sandaracinaceae bacterium]|nr:FkbM family methyltransferase [Sandaracinaceae bacterium]
GVGVLTAHIAKRLSPGKRCICVEANPYLIHVIKHNVRINAPTANVEYLQALISSSQKKYFFLLNFSDLTLSQIVQTKDNIQDQYGEIIELQSMNLSSVIERYELGPYALVMDIEGSELEIIQNDHESLKNCVQIIAELHRCEQNGVLWNQEKIAQAIVDLGFELKDRDGYVFVFERPLINQAPNQIS